MITIASPKDRRVKAVSKKNMVSLFQQQPLTLLSIYDRLKEIAVTIGSGSGKDKTIKLSKTTYRQLTA